MACRHCVSSISQMLARDSIVMRQELQTTSKMMFSTEKDALSWCAWHRLIKFSYIFVFRTRWELIVFLFQAVFGKSRNIIITSKCFTITCHTQRSTTPQPAPRNHGRKTILSPSSFCQPENHYVPKIENAQLLFVRNQKCPPNRGIPINLQQKRDQPMCWWWRRKGAAPSNSAIHCQLFVGYNFLWYSLPLKGFN